MKKIYLLALLFILLTAGAQAQITVYDTLYPTQDAMVSSLFPQINYGQSAYFNSYLKNGRPMQYNERSFIQFDLSHIPAGTGIDTATLHLFGMGHEGQNASWLYMVSDAWEENTIKFNNQPGSLEYNVSLPQSSSAYQDYAVDIKDFVSLWVSNEVPNNGMSLRIGNVRLNPINGLKFGSRDNTDPSKRPYLVLIKEYDSIPQTKLEDKFHNATDIPLYMLIKADPVYMAGAYEFRIINTNSGDTSYITKTSNKFYLSEMNNPVALNTTYSISVRIQLAGTWGEYGEACNLTTVKTQQTVPCDTVMLMHPFASVDGGSITIKLPSGMTVLDTASATGGHSVSVNMTNPQQATYTVSPATGNYTLYYYIKTDCSTFNKNTQTFRDTLSYYSSGNPATAIDSFTVSSPWIVFDNSLSQNIQYNDAFVGQQATRSFTFLNTGMNFSGDFEFSDSLNVPLSASALRFNDIILPAGATLIDQQVSDSSVYIKFHIDNVINQDSFMIQDVVTLTGCPDGNNNKTLFDARYGCSEGSLCTHAEILNNVTMVNESPDDRPVLNYTLLTKGYPECWNEDYERVIKIENTGQGLADTVKILFFPDLTNLIPNLLTTLPINDVELFQKNGTNEIPIAFSANAVQNPAEISNIEYASGAWYIIPEMILQPGDSIFMRYKVDFTCADTSQAEDQFNEQTSMHVHEFPLINLIHPCNQTGYKFITGYAQNDYTFTYSYQHFTMLNQVFENYVSIMPNNDVQWFKIHGDNFSIANPYIWQTEQLGFIFNPMKSQLKIELKLDSGLVLNNNMLFLEANYNGSQMQLLADSIINIPLNSCLNKIVGYFSFPDTFFVASPDTANGFVYLPRKFNLNTQENCFDEFFEDFYIKFQLSSQCGCNSADSKSKIVEETSLIPNVEYPEKCAIPLAKSSDEIMITCPGCLLPGWNLGDFQIKRKNIGFADINNNNFPDTYPETTANPNDVKIHNAIVGDTLEFRLNGFISDGGIIPLNNGDSVYIPFEALGFDLTHGQLTFSNALIKYLHCAGGEMDFADTSGTYPLNIPPTGHLYSNTIAVNLDIDSLQQYGLPSSINRYWRGQSFNMKLLFVVDSNFINPAAPNPYISMQGVDALYLMSGTPFTGVNIKTDANVMIEPYADPFVNLSDSGRAGLAYWCVASNARFTGVGVDMQFPFYSPFVSYYDGFFQSKSPCTNIIHYHASTEVGHQVFFEHNGDQNTWNSFSYEIRNLWMLDSLEFSFPPIYTLDSIVFINTQITNTGSLTHYTPGLWSGCSWHAYNMGDTTMLSDTLIRIYPHRNFDQITQSNACYGSSLQPLFGYDEIKRYRVFFVLSTKHNSPPSAINAVGTYPIKTYWSNFPGAPNGDSVMVQPMKYGAFTLPDANIEGSQINLLNQNQQNGTLNFDVKIGTETFGSNPDITELRYQHMMTDNTFIGIQSPNFTVDSVHRFNSYSWFPIVFSPGNVSSIGNLGNTSVYALGLTGPTDAAQKLRISGHYNCAGINERDSIKVYYGWNCKGYPVNDVHESCFLDSLWIKFNLSNPGLQAVLDTLPGVNACDTISYTLHVTATGLGQVDSVKVKMPLPGSFAYVNNSAQVTYNGVGAGVPASIAGDTVYFYPGQVPLLADFESSSFDFTFRIIPGCGFITSEDEVQLYTSAQNYCGKAMGPVFQSDRPDNIGGLPVHDSLVLSLSGDTLSGCGDTAHISLSVLNAGTQNTSVYNYASITLPAGFVWTGGNAWTSVNGQTYTFALNGNTQPQGNETLQIYIAGHSGAGTLDITAAVYSVQALYCGNDTCYFNQAFAEDNDTASLTVIPLSASATTSAPACYGLCNGTATASVSGLSPFTYQWSNGDSGISADSLCAGNYSLIVSDVNGCRDTLNVNLSQPDALTLSIANVVHPACTSVCNGQATAIAGGGTPGYTYTWSNNSHNATATGLCTGWQEVTISDQHGCSLNDSVLLHESAPVLVSLSATAESCTGACDGSATVSVSSGTPNYTYLWSNGHSTPTITALCPGTYHISVSDANGCSDTGSVSVNAGLIGIPSAQFSVGPDTSCLVSLSPVQLNSLNQSGVTYNWTYGDGSNGSSAQATHTYNDYGYYCVSLLASNACGNSSSTKTLFLQPQNCNCGITFDIADGTTINSGNNHWDLTHYPGGVINVQGDVHIPGGQSLSIIGVRVNFAAKGRIIVERGAFLNINSAQLGSLNNCGMWQGIEVWGNRSYASNNAIQGYAQIRSSKIENAHIAVLLGKRTPYTCGSLAQPFDLAYSGGTASIVTDTLYNNGIGIKYTRKTNTDGSANVIQKNYFANTTLSDAHYNSNNTNHYPNARNPWAAQANPYLRGEAGVMVENLRDFRIESCTFRNAQNGILSFDSKYNVYSCEFKRMVYGVRIENTTTSVDNRHEIASCQFDSIPGVINTTNDPVESKSAAIAIKGGRYDFIHGNIFNDISVQDQAVNNVAIKTDQANSFTIGENQMNYFKTGVYIRNSELNASYVGALGPNWLGNQYTRCATNIQTLGNNSNLKLKCNMCNNPADTLYTVNFKNTGGILSQQGSAAPSFGSNTYKEKHAAGNEFQPYPMPVRKRIESSTNYLYYRQTSPSAVIPETYTSQAYINVSAIGVPKTSNANACPSPLGVVVVDLHGRTFGQSPYNILDSLTSVMEELNFAMQERLESLDGGATQLLLDSINAKPIPAGLKDTLLEHSPLSDTVLIALMETMPLSENDFKVVMQTNLPVSEYVEPLFYKTIEELSEEAKLYLAGKQAYNASAVSPAAMQRAIRENSAMRSLWQNDIIMTLSDTLNNDPATAIELLELDTATNARQTLAGTYLMEGNWTKAGNKLDTLELSNAGIGEWITLTQYLQQQYANGNTLYDLDSSGIAYIREQAYACPANSATAYAQSILYLLFREEVEECEGFEQRSVQTASSIVPKDECEAKVYDYYPAPASDKVSIPYLLPEGTQGWLLLKDAGGRDIAVFELKTGRNILPVDMSAYAAGTYFYGLRTNAGNCSYHKMVIIK